MGDSPPCFCPRCHRTDQRKREDVLPVDIIELRDYQGEKTTRLDKLSSSTVPWLDPYSQCPWASTMAGLWDRPHCREIAAIRRQNDLSGALSHTTCRPENGEDHSACSIQKPSHWNTHTVFSNALFFLIVRRKRVITRSHTDTILSEVTLVNTAGVESVLV